MDTILKKEKPIVLTSNMFMTAQAIGSKKPNSGIIKSIIRRKGKSSILNNDEHQRNPFHTHNGHRIYLDLPNTCDLKLQQNQRCRKIGLDLSGYFYLLVCLGLLLAAGTVKEKGGKAKIRILNQLD